MTYIRSTCSQLGDSALIRVNVLPTLLPGLAKLGGDKSKLVEWNLRGFPEDLRATCQKIALDERSKLGKRPKDEEFRSHQKRKCYTQRMKVEKKKFDQILDRLIKSKPQTRNSPNRRKGYLSGRHG